MYVSCVRGLVFRMRRFFFPFEIVTFIDFLMSVQLGSGTDNFLLFFLPSIFLLFNLFLLMPTQLLQFLQCAFDFAHMSL